MSRLDELIDLSQQLSSVLDDMDRGIISAEINGGNGKVRHFCRPDFLVEHFSSFDVVRRPDSQEFPFGLKTEEEGIVFEAILTEEELGLIRDHLPEDWFEPMDAPSEVIHIDFRQIKNPPASACE